MKIRQGYVSNSSSASFIITEPISKERFYELIKETLYQIMCDRAALNWNVSKLSVRQKAAVMRDMKESTFGKKLG